MEPVPPYANSCQSFEIQVTSYEGTLLTRMAQTEEVLASISICLYSLLALLCGYCGVHFWDFRENKLIEGRYIAPKFQFFVILFVSAMLDIPLYVGCLSKHGAKECMWNDQFYIASQQLHLVGRYELNLVVKDYALMTIDGDPLVNA